MRRRCGVDPEQSPPERVVKVGAATEGSAMGREIRPDLWRKMLPRYAAGVGWPEQARGGIHAEGTNVSPSKRPT
jgi:DNA-binding transcriptional regulator YdaS (Cro superfamily)